MLVKVQIFRPNTDLFELGYKNLRQFYKQYAIKMKYSNDNFGL
jgi:hypothetical protein